MRKGLNGLALLLTCAIVVMSCSKTETPAAPEQVQQQQVEQQLPPLIDREMFFGDPQIANAPLQDCGKPYK